MLGHLDGFSSVGRFETWTATDLRLPYVKRRGEDDETSNEIGHAMTRDFW